MTDERAESSPSPLPVPAPLRLLHDLAACLRFYTRLPVPALPGEADPHALPEFSTCVRMLPLAGVVVGLCGGAVLAASHLTGLPPQIAAGLTLVALVLVTGAFHEDGLADTADGFGGGATRARKLEIMKDSRIGTYGGVALVLSMLLRWAALTQLLGAQGLIACIAALAGIAALSRTMALWLLFSLPPARTEGASYATGRPGAGAMARAFALSILCFLPSLATGTPPGRWAAALLAAAAGVWFMALLSRRQIGGQTGDAAGAAQQVAEIALLVVLCGAGRP